jgi:hypothetical protein
MISRQNSSGFVKSVQNFLSNRVSFDQRSAVFDVRWAMLECLGAEGWRKSPGTLKHILFAEDVEGLWHLRSNVMATLSELHGETIAKQKILGLTPRFQGLIPKPMLSKLVHGASRRG